MCLPCALGRLSMAVFARRFQRLWDTDGVRVHCKGGYVDDLRFIMDSIKLGTRSVKEKLEGNPTWAEEESVRGKSMERITAEVEVEMMKSLFKDISFM